MPRRERLDRLLVARCLVSSREKGQRLIYAGDVRVDGTVARAPAQLVSPDAQIQVRQPPEYVSRGGDKLIHALDTFLLDVSGWCCLDIGASTGGFTDVLLQGGAANVYAVDVGRAQLAWKLRQDPRVIVMEGINARYLEPLPRPVDLLTIDVAFISVVKVLPAVLRSLRATGLVLILVKPQFEAGREWVGRGGVVRDPRIHKMVLVNVLEALPGLGFTPVGLTTSPLRGPAGNVEFFVLGQGAHVEARRPPLGITEAIKREVAAAQQLPTRKRRLVRSHSP